MSESPPAQPSSPQPQTAGDHGLALLVLASPTTAPLIALAGPDESSLLAAGAPAQLAGWGYSCVGETTPPTDLYQASTVVQSTTYCTTQETLDGVLYDPAENVCAVDAPGFAVAACSTFAPPRRRSSPRSRSPRWASRHACWPTRVSGGAPASI
jgi:hypothetical protein